MARVLDALTANPQVWSRTVLLLMFDENDGFFDHMPPPPHPRARCARALAGASTADTRGEYHEIIAGGIRRYARASARRLWPGTARAHVRAVALVTRRLGQLAGLRPHLGAALHRATLRRGRTQHLALAPRRLRRPDIPVRFQRERALLSGTTLPATAARAARAAALPGAATPTAPDQPPPARQQPGLRPSRALPYALHAHAAARGHALTLRLDNPGAAGAVLHVYDRLHLERGPRRYTVEAGKRLDGIWDTATDGGRYDLWVLGPNGFHRHFAGRPAAGAQAAPDIQVSYDAPGARLRLTLANPGKRAVEFHIADAAYGQRAQTRRVAAGATSQCDWDVGSLAGWYDCAITLTDTPAAAFCAAWPDAWKPASPRPRTRHGPGTDTGLESPA